MWRVVVCRRLIFRERGRRGYRGGADRWARGTWGSKVSLHYARWKSVNFAKPCALGSIRKTGGACEDEGIHFCNPQCRRVRPGPASPFNEALHLAWNRRPIAPATVPSSKGTVPSSVASRGRRWVLQAWGGFGHMCRRRTNGGRTRGEGATWRVVVCRRLIFR
jgi:hypothetical protein